jgi:uncharacterized protein YprB with RNaseH-like and TPR domain/predicted nuclease with RNAse H fold
LRRWCNPGRQAKNVRSCPATARGATRGHKQRAGGWAGGGTKPAKVPDMLEVVVRDTRQRGNGPPARRTACKGVRFGSNCVIGRSGRFGWPPRRRLFADCLDDFVGSSRTVRIVRGRRMIESTFLHLPGVGHRSEQQLWKNGVTTWDRLQERLVAGVRIQELLRPDRYYQPELFSTDRADAHEPRSVEWLQTLELSRTALRQGEYAYFLERLDPRDHWRVLAERWQEALYLDVETTGLARGFHHITVIGALQDGKFYQWAWPEPLTQFFGLLRQAPLVVTFNGRRFDVPFLGQQFSQLPTVRAHVDLLDVARAAKVSGGQKEVESLLGLAREGSLKGLGGEDAIQLWSRSLYGDQNSFLRLLHYNRADVEMLPRVAKLLCEQLTRTAVTGTPRPGGVSVMTVEPARPQPAFSTVRESWKRQRAGLHLLIPTLLSKLGRMPVVVGVDLRGNPQNPTGWACCVGEAVETRVLYDDNAIVAATLAAEPAVISIDAPLCLPRGRRSVTDDSPCRQVGGIVRQVERVLWSRGIPVYPALIKHMQGLTRRGMDLARCFQERGLTVIESYPGAAQDIRLFRK